VELLDIRFRFLHLLCKSADIWCGREELLFFFDPWILDRVLDLPERAIGVVDQLGRCPGFCCPIG
jgi:hypothetical protein